MMKSASESQHAGMQFVSFTLAREEYGIPILRVQEIIRYKKLTRIPQSAEFIEGVLNLRGRVIPVVDLRRRFELPENESDHTARIIVVEIKKEVMGLIVDAVSEVRTLDQDCIDPPPPMGADIDTEFISGMGKLEDRLIILLELDHMFSAREREEIAKTAA